MVPVVGVDQEVNLTAVLLPLNPNLTVFYWWIGHSLQVRRPQGSPGGELGAGREDMGCDHGEVSEYTCLPPGAAARVRLCLHLMAVDESRPDPAFSWGRDVNKAGT